MDDVSTAILVDEDQMNGIVKRPLQQLVMVSFHENKEDGEVCSIACSTPIEVGSDAHFVAIPIGRVGSVSLCTTTHTQGTFSVRYSLHCYKWVIIL